MTEEEKNRELINRKFYKAEQEAGFVESHPRTTPQQQDPAYRLAFRDTDFLLREELRPVRFQLELLKPDMLLDEAGIGSTLVMYGSARIPSPDHVEGLLAAATSPERKAVADLFVPGFQSLARDYGVEQFQFHTPPAISWLRVHVPQKYGDDSECCPGGQVAAPVEYDEIGSLAE